MRKESAWRQSRECGHLRGFRDGRGALEGILGAPWELLSCSGALPKAGLGGFSAELGVTLRGQLRDT